MRRTPHSASSARLKDFPFIPAMKFTGLLTAAHTARTESFLRGNPSLDDTIKRLQAFEQAGADVLMAPGLPDLAAVKAVCSAVKKPVNFMAGIKGKSFTVAELTAAGVRRISLATSLYRTAIGGMLAAAKEVHDHGTFGYLDTALTTPELNNCLG